MEWSIVAMNIGYATTGALLTIGFMLIGYKIFDKMTPFDTAAQLEKNNTAIGIVVGSIFIGLGIAVGLVIGLGLN